MFKLVVRRCEGRFLYVEDTFEEIEHVKKAIMALEEEGEPYTYEVFEASWERMTVNMVPAQAATVNIF
jgi:hypothetical protein